MSDFIEQRHICQDEEAKILCQNLIKAHCSNDVFPKLIHYIETRTQEEWVRECTDACVAMVGIKGYALADFVIEAMRGVKKYEVVTSNQASGFSFKRFIRKRFGHVIRGRLRWPLMRIYYILKLDRLG